MKEGGLKTIVRELQHHAPFTFLGASSGILFMLIFRDIPEPVAHKLFYVFHPLHVFLSALVTAAMYELHECGRISGKCLRGECNLWKLLVIGYTGSVGIATLSDSVIPYLGEVLLELPNRGIHIGFIERWWLVNPLALAGIAFAYFRPVTKFPHAMHVLISTWASLFHMLMALGGEVGLGLYFIIFIFLFLAVWVPCCVSDIVFPLLFVKEKNRAV